MEESLLSFCSLQWRNTCYHFAHCKEESLLLSCSLHEEIPALILLTVWTNLCSLPAHCMKKYLLLSCWLFGGIPALILLTTWRNNLLSSCSLYGGISALFLPLHGEMPAHILLTVRRNLCFLSATAWKNTFSLPAHFMEVFLLLPYSQHGRISAHLAHCMEELCSHPVTLLTVWRNPCSHPARCMEESLNHFNQLKRAGAQQGFLFKDDFPIIWVGLCWASIWWTLLKFATTQNWQG
jgi:hypothetical protein